MADRIKGITIELDGETTGLKKALSGVTKQSVDIQRELTDVNRLLKFDPGNTEALAQKQELLSKQIEITSQKLQTLKDAQDQVNEQFKQGKIGEDQYRAFQREIQFTEASLNNFKKTYEEATKLPDIDTSSITKVDKETQKLNRQLERLKMQLGGEIPPATEKAFLEMQKLNSEIRSSSREYGRYSTEVMSARNKLNEYVLGLDDTTFKQIYMKNQLGLTNTQLQQQANSIKLNARMVSLMGSQTEILVNRMKGLQQHGIKPEDFKTASTIGQFQMLNETMNASGNSINKLSALYRSFGTSMEKSIKGWSAQKMAIKLAQGDMVKYGLLLRGITASQMNLGLAFPVVGIAAVAAYAKIFSSAMNANEGLQKLAETTKGKLTQAFKPLLDVAGKVLEVFLKLTIKISDMVIKFEQIYPIMSKVIASLVLLAPAFTLLLLPLSTGIGLLNGWKVAINGLWVLIGGVASAIGIATSTFLVLAAVIGTVAWSFSYLLKTNETFRNAVLPIWNSISKAAETIFKGIGNVISKSFVESIELAKKTLNGMVELFLVTLPNAFKTGGFEGLAKKIGETFINLGKEAQSGITKTAKIGADFVKNISKDIETNLPTLIDKGSKIAQSISSGVETNLPKALNTGSNIVKSIVDGVTTTAPILWSKMGEVTKPIATTIQANLPSILATGSQIVTNLIQGISTALPNIVTKMNETRLLILNAIASNLPSILQTGVQIITMLIQGIAQALPTIMTIGIQIITAVINTIVENLPTIISTGLTVLTTFIDGIIQALPVLIGAGMQILLALVNAITENLPQIIKSSISIINTLVDALIKLLPIIIDAGIKILIALIDGLTKALPQLIAMLPTIINTIITIITENLPQIITAGIQILVAIINGLVQALPQLIAMLPQIISTITTVLIQNLPLIIDAGIKILVAVINGLIQAIPQLVAAIPQIATAIIDAFKQVDWGSIGKNIISGIGKGIEDEKDRLLQKAANIATGIKKIIKDALDIHSPSRWMRDMIGVNIVKGIGVGIDSETPSLLKDTSSMIGALQSSMGFDATKTISNVSKQANALASAAIPNVNAGTYDMNVNSNPIGSLSSGNGSNLDAILSKMDSLEKALSNMKILMDSKEVGKLVTPAVSSNLAFNSGRKGWT